MRWIPCEKATEPLDRTSLFRLIFALRKSSIPIVIPGDSCGMRLILHIAACGAIALTFAVPALSLTCGLILWTLVTLVVAIRQALDYCSTRRAILFCALTSPLAVLPLMGVLVMTGPPWPF